MSDLDECRKCGAAMVSASKHRRWHQEVEQRIEELDGTANEALERAEDAQNTLYQKGIQL